MLHALQHVANKRLEMLSNGVLANALLSHESGSEFNAYIIIIIIMSLLQLQSNAAKDNHTIGLISAVQGSTYNRTQIIT